MKCRLLVAFSVVLVSFSGRSVAAPADSDRMLAEPTPMFTEWQTRFALPRPDVQALRTFAGLPLRPAVQVLRRNPMICRFATVALLAFAIQAPGNAQADPDIRGLINSVDSGSISKHLFHLARTIPFRKLNVTLPGHAKNTLYEADDYIAENLQSWGYRVEKEGVQVQAYRRDKTKPISAQYSKPMPDDPWYTAYNLYAEKKGRSRPDDIILLVAHKDSQSWIDSPGANDNAIGTSGVLEIARVLAKHAPERTIRFLFCNEEHTPWTSVTAAQNAKKRGDRIIAVFNLDALGGKPAAETAAHKLPNVAAYTAPEGARLAELVGTVNARYGIGLEHRTVKRRSPGDDDGSFVKAGYPAAIILIGSWPYGDPNYHVPEDTPERSDVPNATKQVQAALAAVLTLDQER